MLICAAVPLASIPAGCSDSHVRMDRERPEQGHVVRDSGLDPALREPDAQPALGADSGAGAGAVDAAVGNGACAARGAHEPLMPGADETCYDFVVHGESSPTDGSPFPVPRGETYNHFYYAVPWSTGAIATAYGVVIDNPVSIHAWAFGSSSPHAPGTVAREVTGTTLGEDAFIVGAWAVGGCNVVLPQDVGLQLPRSDRRLLVQWHHSNATGAVVDTTSAFRICTAAPGSRRHLAGITMLGTEDLNAMVGMPPGANQFGSTCQNDFGGDITIVGLDPHMHQLGVRASAVVRRAAGGTQTVLDQRFQFDVRDHYLLAPPIVLHAGDAIETICSFNNTTGTNVAYGQSASAEMCYQFAIAYPSGALDNGVLSLIGATNICW